MPSLKQLDAFKKSFLSIGNESKALRAAGLELEDFPLPPVEAKPSSSLPPELGGMPVKRRLPTRDEPSPGDAQAEPEPDGFPVGDLDFSDFTVSPEGLPEIPDDFADSFPTVGEEIEQLAAQEAEAGLAGPSGEVPLETDAADTGMDGDAGLGSPGDLNAGGEGAEQAEFPPPDMDPFSIPDDVSFDAPPADVFDGAAGAPPDTGAPEMPSDEVPAGGAGDDLFDGFDLDSAAAEPPPPDADGGGETPSFPDLDSLADGFDLKGIDDVFGSNKAAPSPAAAASPPKAGGAASLPRKPAQREVEEINLNDEDYARLEETLASYPLNLRIVCEEIIVEQAVTPELMSAFVRLLIRGGTPREAASMAGKILGHSVPLPKGAEKKTGEELEAEQASFYYIFFRQFLPLFRIFMFFALVAASLFYLAYQFIYKPLRAESLYKQGHERITAGEYERANERFSEAFSLHRNRNWFYRYAEGFRDERQYIYAEKKYEDLLRYYPRNKKGVLDYAAMESAELRNYPQADRILRQHLLDYAVNDREGLIALGDNNLAWGDVESERYENARQAYARLLELYGWEDDSIVERMMRYFIRTDQLGEVLPLQRRFIDNPKRKIRPDTLAELGGYLLDKRLEETKGVPDENIRRIEGIREVLQRAAQAAPDQPEPHYHLARYYSAFGAPQDERTALERAIRGFDTAREETARRMGYRIDAERRYARSLISTRDFIDAERELTKGITAYRDALERQIISRSPEFGRLYADLGDLEYFVKSGDMNSVLEFYRLSEEHGWAPVEMQYRMGAAHYQLRQWEAAMNRFFNATAELPLNRRLLYAIGNVLYQRGDYSLAQGYYSRLLDLLEADRARFPILAINERTDHLELAERMMVARNNMGVTMEALADRTGRASYRSGALGLFTESARAWDAITRDPATMVRSGAGDMSNPGMNLAYINSRNSLYPVPDFEPQLYLHIDKDVLEPSPWEELSPAGRRLSSQL